MFERARTLEPSVVLIDELDSLAPRRDALIQSHTVQLIAQLLVLLDGLEARGRIVVLGATNRPEALDPALLRPGRLDYHLELPLPTVQGRAAILAVHLGRLKGHEALDYPAIAHATDGFSGADLAGLVREAGLTAILRAIDQKIPPESLALTRPDLQRALTSLKAKRPYGAA